MFYLSIIGIYFDVQVSKDLAQALSQRSEPLSDRQFMELLKIEEVRGPHHFSGWISG
jgi:hypothetical protein